VHRPQQVLCKLPCLEPFKGSSCDQGRLDSFLSGFWKSKKVEDLRLHTQSGTSGSAAL
jgi:hypothetical protein